VRNFLKLHSVFHSYSSPLGHSSLLQPSSSIPTSNFVDVSSKFQLTALCISPHFLDSLLGFFARLFYPSSCHPSLFLLTFQEQPGFVVLFLLDDRLFLRDGSGQSKELRRPLVLWFEAALWTVYPRFEPCHHCPPEDFLLVRPHWTIFRFAPGFFQAMPRCRLSARYPIVYFGKRASASSGVNADLRPTITWFDFCCNIFCL
jgi:hypothetical protein